MRQTDKLSNSTVEHALTLMMTISVPSELACLALLGSAHLSSAHGVAYLGLAYVIGHSSRIDWGDTYFLPP
jgi:hypothetical protein